MTHYLKNPGKKTAVLGCKHAVKQGLDIVSMSIFCCYVMT